jgi:hypothetical protein
MDLSNKMVSEFVKVTKDTPKAPNTSAYGKVVIYDDNKYVQLDGSDLLTPADTTVHVNDGERVTVSINGHNATINGNLSDISASNGDLMQFKVNTDGMFLTLRDEFDTKMSDFKITTDGMFLEVKESISGIDAKLTEFKVTSDGMFVNVQNNINAIDTKLTEFQVTSDGMFVNVQNNIDTVDKKLAEFKVTSDGMFANVGSNIDAHTQRMNTMQTDLSWLGGQNEEVHNLCASLSVRADQIQSAVTGKIGASDVGTIVTQNATSWNLSINGKLKGTNYNFDGSNFTIGSSSGNTTAYHAAGYSKWVHSDGSYTRVDANGLTWSKGGTASTYHCLLYGGEYTCDSESTVTIPLPSEFIGKNFKVLTAVKRIYTSSSDHVTSAYFPLISFYAEALNLDKNTGTFQIYASVRAWNRTSYGGYGTIIGDGNWNEKQLVKPVVAFWAFV